MREWTAGGHGRLFWTEEAEQEALFAWSKKRTTKRYARLDLPAKKASLRRVVRSTLNDFHSYLTAQMRAGDLAIDEVVEETLPAGREVPDPELKLILDVAISRLTPHQQEICRLLQIEPDISAVARVMNLDRGVVIRQMEKIKAIFTKIGLKPFGG